MFLIFFNVFYVFFGSSCGLLHKKVCYGDSVDMDLHALPFSKRLYFHPREGGAMKLLMVDQEAKDPRLEVSTYSAKLTQLTEKDNGKFFIARTYGGVTDILLLTVIDCSLNISLFYGEELVHDVPSGAELLEFTPFDRLNESQILWERANPHINYGGRGKVIEDIFRISKVTQEDNGIYNFKQKDKSVVLQIQLTVKEKMDRHEFEEDKNILIPFPWADENWTVTFKQSYNGRDVTIIQAGSVVRNDNPFHHKMIVTDSDILIFQMKYSESGTFKFKDPAGNLALVSELIPSSSTDFEASIVFKVGFVAFIVFQAVGCCLCFKMFCCKNGKPPSQIVQTAEELKTYYHDLNECEGSGFSAAPNPAAFPPPAGNAGISHDAAAVSSGPVVTPQASEKSAPSSSFGYNPLSSDYQPMFEVKGLNSTFDVPLSTENSSADVTNPVK